jgi:hypothetical protein
MTRWDLAQGSQAVFEQPDIAGEHWAFAEAFRGCLADAGFDVGELQHEPAGTTGAGVPGNGANYIFELSDPAADEGVFRFELHLDVLPLGALRLTLWMLRVQGQLRWQWLDHVLFESPPRPDWLEAEWPADVVHEALEAANFFNTGTWLPQRMREFVDKLQP